MGVTVARTRFAARTTNGDQSITASLGGLTPKAVLFTWSYATADGTATDGFVRGIGMTDGTNQGSVFQYDDHGQASSVTSGNKSSDYCIWLEDDAGNTLAVAVIKSLDTNGATITWTVTTGTAILIDAVFFAGSDLSTAVTNTAVTNVVDTAHDITAPGFEPDDVIAFSSGSNGVGFGAVHNDRAGGITQRAALHRHRPSRPTMEIFSSFTESYGCVSDSGAYAADGNCYYEFSSFDSSGFTATTRNAAPGAGVVLFTLSLRYGASPVVSSKVYTFSTPTSTGSSTDSNPNFTPQFVLYYATLMEAAATYYSNSLAGSSALITMDANGQNCTAWSSEDAAADSNTQSLIDDVAVNLPLHDGSAGMAATFSSFAATGPTLSWSDVEASAKKWVGFAIEAEAAGGITEEIGLAAETDTPQALSHAKSKALSLETETDTPLALVTAKMLAIGLAGETETVFSLTALKSRTLGLAVETDSPQAISSAKVKAIELVTESDAALAVTVVKSRAIGLVTETNTVQALTSAKMRALGLATETDTPLAVSSGGVAIGLATETDTPLGLTAVKTKAIGLVAETDTTLSLATAKARLIGLATEGDAALAMAAVKARAIGLATEADTPLAVTAAGATIIGLVTETDTPLGLIAVKTKTLSLVVETDSALSMVTLKSRTIGLSIENNNALAVAIAKARSLGLTTETDTPLQISTPAATFIGQATESDNPLGLTALKTAPLGLVTETDTALAMTVVKSHILGLLIETDATLALAMLKMYALGLLTETNTPYGITYLPPFTSIGTVTVSPSGAALQVPEGNLLVLVDERLMTESGELLLTESGQSLNAESFNDDTAAETVRPLGTLKVR